MSKSTYLEDLLAAYRTERVAIQNRCLSTYKNRDNSIREEVCRAHNRKIIRSAQRAIGKSNKNGCRRTAKGIARMLEHNDFWAHVCRSNREALKGNAGEGQ